MASQKMSFRVHHIKSTAAPVLALGLTVLPLGCHKQLQNVESPAGMGGQIRPYTGAMEKDDGQWVRATKDYANIRYRC